MKKVLISVPHDSFFLPVFKRVFNKLGFKVYYYDYRYGDMSVRIIRLILGKNIAQNYLNSRMTNLLARKKPDFLMVVKGENLDPEVLQKFRNQNCICINWFPDPISYLDIMIKTAPSYNYFFHFDPLIIRKLKKIGLKNIYYLPFAAEDTKIRQKKVYDVSFVGTYDQYREKYFNNLKDFNLNIWGDKRWFMSSLKQFAQGDRVSPEEMDTIIQKSKINLNLIYNAKKEGTNLRTFQGPCNGAFLLTEYVKDLPNLFKIGKELETFKNPSELKKKIIIYLKESKKRENIAKAGYKRFKKDHTFEKRIKQMLKIINS